MLLSKSPIVPLGRALALAQPSVRTASQDPPIVVVLILFHPDHTESLGRPLQANALKFQLRQQTTDQAHDDTTLVPRPVDSGLLASMRRGTGGRCSFNGVVATVFGATGAFGRYLVNRLGKEGSQVIIPYRGDPYEARHLRLAGDLGQILYFPFHLRDEDSLRKVMKHSNTVINLIGREWETSNFTFEDVHVEGARRIARIAREMGVQKLIHMSALNADPHPPENLIPGGSGFLRTKGLGEIAVREEFPDATIVRPAVMFSFEDRFINFYMNEARRYFQNKMDMFARGEKAYKMPVFMGDVAHGMNLLVSEPTAPGKTYEFPGPFSYKIGELVDWMMEYCHRGYKDGYRRNNIGPYFTFKVNVSEAWLKFWKYSYFAFNWEMIERHEATSDVLTGCPTLTDLGIDPTVFELWAPQILQLYDADNYYFYSYGEDIRPPHPPHYEPLRKGRLQPPEFKGFQEKPAGSGLLGLLGA